MTGKFKVYIVRIFFLFFIPINLFSQHYPISEVDYLISNGVKNVLEQNYQEAEKLFNKLNDNYPEIPLGNIYLASVSISKAFDYGTEFDVKYIENKFEAADQLCEKLLKSDPDNVWNVYFSALENGYEAYYYILQDNYIKAFKYGLSSYTDYKKCFSMDSTFYEALIAIGTYKYWRSEKTKSLSWLPFINDEREEGVKYLKTAIKKSSYNHYLAVYSLIWIEINCKHSEKAVELAKLVLNKFPDCRFFKWALARAYEDVDIRKAISEYREILESFSGLKNNHYNEIVLKHKMAMLYHRLHEDNKSLLLCNEILKINNLPDYVTDRLGDRLKRVHKLKLELSEN